MSNSITFYLNKCADKTAFDRFTICKQTDDKFTVYYKSDVTKDTYSTVTPITLSFTAEGIEEYIEDIMDLLYSDVDNTPHTSIDIMIPALPIVAISTTVRANKCLLTSVVRRWMRRGSAEKTAEN